MTRPRADEPPPFPAADGSWTGAVSAALSDVEFWPTTDQALVTALPSGPLPALELWPEIAIGSIAADEGPSSLLAAFGAPWLGLTEWTTGSSLVLSVTGEVDIATTSQLSDALGAVLRRGVKGLVCDLSGVGFFGAAGVTTLLEARRHAIACHSWFDLVCPQSLPRKVIALLDLDAVLSIYDRPAEAVHAQARREGLPG